MRNLSVELRPRDFSEVLGNDTVVRALRERLSSGAIPTAIMFVGPPGVGKTTLAHIIAQTLNSSDVREFNASDQTGVDDMRELVKSLAYGPLTGKYTVVILDECHKLTEPAQNVLLLPTERKDSQVVWIFCTTDPNKIIPALRKRCLTFALAPLKGSDRLLLASRAVGVTPSSLSYSSFSTALEKSSLTAPRDILMACEKFLAGVPPAEAVKELGVDHDPAYQEVARAVLSGDWTKTSEMLNGFRSTDARGLKGTVLAFLANSATKCDIGERGDALKQSGYDLMLYGSSFADGEVFSAVKLCLYAACKRLKN